MILKLFTIFDNKVNAYGVPMYYKSEEELYAQMQTFFINALTDKSINPIEHEIFEIGTYDTDNAKHILLEAPKHIANAKAIQHELINKLMTGQQLQTSKETESKKISKAQLELIEQEVN